MNTKTSKRTARTVATVNPKSQPTGTGTGDIYRHGAFGPVLTEMPGATLASLNASGGVRGTRRGAYGAEYTPSTGDITGAGTGATHKQGVSPGRGAYRLTVPEIALPYFGPAQPGVDLGTYAQPGVVIVAKAQRGKVRGKVARAVGVGDDEATKLAKDFAAWCESSSGRAAIGAKLTGDRAAWHALQSLGERAAWRAARRVTEARGANPSQTSRDDAQADAIAAVAARFPLGCMSPRNYTPRSARLRVLAKYAGRGASKSLTTWAVAGMTGDDKATRFCTVSELTPVLADTLSHACATGTACVPSEYGARVAACRWVWRVAVGDFAATLTSENPGARATALASAKSRARVVSNVIMGATLFDAVAQSQFATVANFTQSCTRSGLLAALAIARAKQSGDGAHVEQARIAMRSHALRAAQIIQRLDGWQDATGRQTILARRLFDARARELELAIHYRDVAKRAVRADCAAFARIVAGLHHEDCDLSNLRLTLGIVDKRGRVRNGAKIDGAARKRATGDVQTGARGPMVARLTVATRYGTKRKLACAPLV